MLITSPDNSTIKNAAKLKEKKYRDESGKYLIEGYRAVKDSLPYLPDFILILSESASRQLGEEFSEYAPVIVSDTIMKKLADTDNSQGIICVASKRVKEPEYNKSRALLLDRIRDPGNMGTIIRSALATGFNDIYCYDCVDVYNPKVVRSAMSAVSRVNIYSISAREINLFKDNGYKLLCADMSGEDIFKKMINEQKICLIIGNEANGVSDLLLSMSDIVLSLPMEEAESLNAGVCASIMMYQLRYAK